MMKYQKTIQWYVKFDTRIALITNHYPSKTHYWEIKTRTLDLGWGDNWEWTTLEEGEEKTLAAAKRAIKKARRTKNEST